MVRFLVVLQTPPGSAAFARRRRDLTHDVEPLAEYGVRNTVFDLEDGGR